MSSASLSSTDDLPLPAGWTKKMSESRGRPYYVNSATKERRWHHPARDAGGAGAGAAAEVPPPPPPLPAGSGVFPPPVSPPPPLAGLDLPPPPPPVLGGVPPPPPPSLGAIPPPPPLDLSAPPPPPSAPPPSSVPPPSSSVPPPSSSAPPPSSSAPPPTASSHTLAPPARVVPSPILAKKASATKAPTFVEVLHASGSCKLVFDPTLTLENLAKIMCEKLVIDAVNMNFHFERTSDSSLLPFHTKMGDLEGVQLRFVASGDREKGPRREAPPSEPSKPKKAGKKGDAKQELTEGQFGGLTEKEKKYLLQLNPDQRQLLGIGDDMITAARAQVRTTGGTLRVKKAQRFALPEGWETRLSRNKKRSFYYNPATSEKFWKLPPGLVLLEDRLVLQDGQTWRSIWLTLKTGGLLEISLTKGGAVTDAIKLTGASIDEESEDGNPHHVFHIKLRDRVVTLKGKNPVEMHTWVNAMMKEKIETAGSTQTPSLPGAAGGSGSRDSRHSRTAIPPEMMMPPPPAAATAALPAAPEPPALPAGLPPPPPSLPAPPPAPTPEDASQAAGGGLLPPPPALAGAPPPALAGAPPPALAGVPPPSLAGVPPPALAGAQPRSVAATVNFACPVVQILRDFFGRWAADDLDGLKELCAPDVVLRTPTSSLLRVRPGATGPDALVAFFKQRRTKVREEAFRITSATTEGERVVVEGVNRGTVLQSGSAFEHSWVFVFAMAGGQISAVSQYFDYVVLGRLLDAV